MHKILILSLCFIIITVNIAFSEHEKGLTEFLKKEDVHIFGIKRLSETTIVIIKSGERFFGNFLILAYSEQDKLISTTKGYFKSSYYPFYFNEHYFVIAGSDETGSEKLIFVYDEKKKDFIKLKREQSVVGYVVIFDNYLYYSTEKTEYCIRKFNLEDGEEIKYRIYTPNARFYIIDNSIYIKYWGEAYLIAKDEIITKNISVLEGKDPEQFDLEDLKTEDFEKYEKILGINK